MKKLMLMLFFVFLVFWGCDENNEESVIPLDIVEVGLYKTKNASGLYVSGSYAYIAFGDSGLRIIDISNPSSPVEVGHYDTPGWAYNLWVSGRYAYIADMDALRIIDISNPAFPYGTGVVEAGGAVTDVVVSGCFAYMTATTSTFAENGLAIIDVFCPSKPHMISFISLSLTFPFRYIYLLDDYLYTVNSDGRLDILDVSSPSLIQWKGYNEIATYAYDIFVTGEYIYVCTDEGLKILRWLE